MQKAIFSLQLYNFFLSFLGLFIFLQRGGGGKNIIVWRKKKRFSTGRLWIRSRNPALSHRLLYHSAIASAFTSHSFCLIFFPQCWPWFSFAFVNLYLRSAWWQRVTFEPLCTFVSLHSNFSSGIARIRVIWFGGIQAKWWHPIHSSRTSYFHFDYDETITTFGDILGFLLLLLGSRSMWEGNKLSLNVHVPLKNKRIDQPKISELMSLSCRRDSCADLLGEERLLDEVL